MTKARYRPRKEVKTWLYWDIPEQAKLIDFLQYCKTTRQLARVIRDGIRLIWSLRENNLDVLFELFPHLESRFKQQALPDSSDLQRQISAAVAVGVQQAMLEMPALPSDSIVALPAMKPVNAPPKVETKAAAVMSADSIADNFLLSIMQ